MWNAVNIQQKEEMHFEDIEQSQNWNYMQDTIAAETKSFSKKGKLLVFRSLEQSVQGNLANLSKIQGCN